MTSPLEDMLKRYEDYNAGIPVAIQPQKGGMNSQLATTDYLLIIGIGLGLVLLFPPVWARLSRRRSRQHSSNARWILAGVGLALALLLYPPFWHGNQYGSGHRLWHFVLAGHRGHLDMSMLCLEFLVAGVGLGAAWYVSTLSKEEE